MCIILEPACIDLLLRETLDHAHIHIDIQLQIVRGGQRCQIAGILLGIACGADQFAARADAVAVSGNRILAVAENLAAGAEGPLDAPVAAVIGIVDNELGDQLAGIFLLLCRLLRLIRGAVRREQAEGDDILAPVAVPRIACPALF